MLTISELTNKNNPAITLVHFNADKRTIVIKLNTDILYVALALNSDLPIKITTIRKEAVQAANEYCVSYLCAKYIDKGYSLQDIFRDLLMNEDITFDGALNFIKHYKQKHLHIEGETITLTL